MSEDTKPKLGVRPQLGVKRTTEVSQVKQSFSHGRTHKVVVETKKARVLRRPGDATPAEAEAVLPPQPVAPLVPQRAAPAPSAPPPGRASAGAAKPVAPPPPFRTLAEGAPPAIATLAQAPAAQAADAGGDAEADLLERPQGPAEAQTARAEEPVAAEPAQTPAEPPAAPAMPVAEARPRPATAAPQRSGARPAPPPRPAPSPELASIQKALQNPRLSPRERQQLLVRMAEEERLVRAEEARIREGRARDEAADAERRRLEEKARVDAEAREAEARAAEAAEATQAAQAAPAAPAAPPAETDEADQPRKTRRAEPAARPTRARVDDRRQSGKLTISRALGDEDGVRSRSLAALRRAQEKQKRAHGGGRGATQRNPREVQIPEAITVQELANRMAERGAALVKSLFKMGMATTITAPIDQDTAELLVTEFGHIPRRVSDADVEIGLSGPADRADDMALRAPVVTVMGHVDHGKTSLLDALRGTDVVGGEAGGITQHIGAYQVKPADAGAVTFLDTPGHEAFTEMRARGANVTDIVVLVVAADDGLMPQTIEAINHVKAARVPMIVAINKMDKPGANAERVRTALLSHDVQVENMGGEVLDVEVSALKRTGLDELMQKIHLQAELLELKANPGRAAEATVVEARLDRGRGPVATLLVRRGTIRRGDIFVVGAEWGKVRALVNDRGDTVAEAGPAVPVEVLGLSGVPMAGDVLTVVDSEARAREIAAYRQSQLTMKRTAAQPASLESLFSSMREAKAIEFPVVVKGDTHGSVEAIVSAIGKLGTDEIRARVLHSGVGGITESDVTLARASQALVIGFNVRPNAKAREVAHQSGVALKYYEVIYDLVDELKVAMAGRLGPERFETVVGRAEVREVFSAGKFGKAAGVMVAEGQLRRNLRARVLRDDVIVHTAGIASLRRFKDDVNEVRQGYECGVALEGFQDYRPQDIIETFEVEERLRSL